MGRKKAKRAQNRPYQFQSPGGQSGFGNFESPVVQDQKEVFVEDPNIGEEVEIPANNPYKPSKHEYQTVFMSDDNVTSSRGASNTEKRGGSNSSSYHDLMDGGAYDNFRSSRQSLHRSKLDLENAGDRVIAGSRSISHRSLFSNDPSFSGPPKTIGSMSLQWDDGDEDQVRISRSNSTNLEGPSHRRSRTVSSGGSNRNLHLLSSQPFSSSHRALESMPDDVRTFHAGSEYLQNRLSKLSIHSNNDEFVLVGGHPPQRLPSSELLNSAPIPRPRSRLSSLSFNDELDPGKSVSQQSLGAAGQGHVSRTSSRHSVGTTSNTDDRLILAARYSQSPEAEGLLSHHSRSSGILNGDGSRRSSFSRSATSDHVGFAEIPTLYSHPDEKFDDQEEPGEPFRPTSEHTSTPTNVPRSRPSLVRSDALNNQNEGFSSSSSSVSNRDQPPKALLVTSALTPVIPKRDDLSRSEESLVMETPQTVQRVTSGVARNFRQQDLKAETRKMVETAVQTGNSIRLRQTQHFTEVLSECANLPEPPVFGLSPAKTASYFPKENTDNQETKIVTIPKADDPKDTFRARLRHISDIYSTDGNQDETDGKFVEIPKNPSSGYSGKYVEIPAAQKSVDVEISRNPSTGYSGKYVEAQKSIEIPKNGPKMWAGRKEEKEVVEIPKNYGIPSQKSTDGNWDETDGKFVEIPAQKSIEIPRNGPRMWAGRTATQGNVEIPKNYGNPTEARFVEIPTQKSTDYSGNSGNGRFSAQKSEIVIPISMASKKENDGKDTIRNHIPRGRIRDLASAFNKVSDESPILPISEPVWRRAPMPSESTNSIHGSSNSSAFRSSTQTIRSQEEARRRSRSSTSSSLQPHVFTRNTFLTSSSVGKPGNLPESVAMDTTTHSGRGVGSGEFVTAFEKIQNPNKPIRTSQLYSDGDRGSRSSIRKSSIENPGFRSSVLNLKSDDDQGSRIGGFKSSALNFDDDQTSRIGGFRRVPIQKPSAPSPTKFSEYSRKIEIPTSSRAEKLKKSRFAEQSRAKTQEIPSGRFDFERYEEKRAVSGDLKDFNESSVFGAQKPLFAASREAFGRETAEDLRGKQDNWRQQQVWSSEYEMSHVTTTNHHQKKQDSPTTTFVTSSYTQINPKRQESMESRKSVFTPSLRAATGHPHPYSPPATEDAGSRITHHTSQTLQSEDLFAATEDSSIRGKIDRMFDFVESDDSRKLQKGGVTLGSTKDHSNASTDTIGNGNQGIRININHNNNNNNIQKYREPYSPPRLVAGKSAAEIPASLKRDAKLKSPERRATVTVPELEFFDNDLEYSLSQYREIQREQLRRRLPSSEEPQFFRSPMMSAPHAGQSLHAYRTKDLMGTPTAGEKFQFRFPPSSSGLKLQPPSALATSTPLDSPASRTSFSIRDPQFSHLLNQESSTTNLLTSAMMPPNDTFVSSISGVSAVDKHADVMRKINRMSYMIENTQKQMTMNEAALADAVKKGRRSQEIAAHRSILISRETLRLQRNELRRLHAFSAVRRPPPPMAKELRGSVVFKDLIVHLNKLFVSRLTMKDDNSYSFVALFKFGHQVEATELVPLRVYPGEETCDKLFFVKQIQFSDVPIDFMVNIEIYAMRVNPAKPVEVSIGSSFANKCKSLMGPPQRKSHSTSSDSAFKFRGRLVLDRDAAGERCLYLDDVTYPLEGTVMITTQCSRLPEAFESDFCGFLTMFHTISEMASWERYWAVVRRGVVLFWKYPEDEQNGREPKMQIDLTKCTNNSIEKCAFDLCPRSNSFAIEILVDSDEASTIGSVVEKKRVLLSADTCEMLSQWLYTLNQTLDVIRGPI